jgi:hypothetical protein
MVNLLHMPYMCRQSTFQLLGSAAAAASVSTSEQQLKPPTAQRAIGSKA